MLFRILMILLLPFIAHARYIDTRDMSQESQRIQRLLGQLDALKIVAPPVQQYKGPNPTKFALLSMMSSGLAIASINSHYRYPHYHYYNRRPYRRRYDRYYYKPDPVASAVGASVFVGSLIGLIALAANEEESSPQRPSFSQQNQLKNIEIEIQKILSNLVVTDLDFVDENKNFQANLSQSVDKNILEINQLTSNQIENLKLKEQQFLSNFINETNQLKTGIELLDKDLINFLKENSMKMQQQKVSKEYRQELAAISKYLKQETKKKQKELSSLIKSKVKVFSKEYPKIQKDTKEQITRLEEQQNSTILSELENAENQKNELFKKYVDLYINKLAVY